jgi:hypothetical protein
MKDMKEMIAKLTRIVQELYDERLSLNLFALFLRDGNEKWDLLVSSEWIDRDKYGSLKYIESKLKKELSQEELLEISGMVIIDDMSIIDDINRAIHKYPRGVTPPGAEIENINLSGIIIRYGYIIISNPLRVNLVLV